MKSFFGNNRRLRFVIASVAMFFPWSLKRRLLSWLLGYQLHPKSKIGFSIISVTAASMGEGAQIGHLTVCRGVSRLILGDHARIGNLNWITGWNDPLSRPGCNDGIESALVIGSHSAITHRHYIDCSDRVEIGAFTTVAGVRSQIFTHSINLEVCAQQTCPIAIGDYCFVGTGCIILPGARLPNFSVLAAGSVLRNCFEQEWTLYAGTPAQAKKKIPAHHAYFHRAVGFVR